MKHPTLTLRRADLVAARACAEWLATFDAICALRGDDRAPLVRRGGVSRRDPQRLRIELTPLAQLWMARDARGAVTWLRGRGVLGPVYAPWVQAPGIDLGGADLGGADLGGADLRGADLGGNKLVSERPLLLIGPIGSRSDYLHAFITEAGVMVRAGCFTGTRDEFAARVEKDHRENVHGKEYAAALVLIDAHAALWTPAVEAVKEAA